MALKAHAVFNRHFNKRRDDATQLLEAAAPAVEIHNLSAFDVDETWMVDSGSGRDLIGSSKCNHFPGYICAALEVALSTGGGSVRSTKALECIMNLGGFIARIKAYVLKGRIPTVISIGARVCGYGYVFVWFPGRCPGIVAPNGLVIALIERHNTPHISARCIYDAIRDPQHTEQRVGVCVRDGELQLVGVILVGELALSSDAQYEEAAMPTSEGGATSSTDGQPTNEGSELGTKKHMKKETQKQEVKGPELRTSDDENVEATPPTSAGEEAPTLEPEDTDTEWEADENEVAPVRRVLRDEANSVAHYLLHRPGLPSHCQECYWAKMKRKKRFCGAYNGKKDKESTKYGQNTTCDHVYFKDIYKIRGVDGYAEALTFLDRHTDFRGGTPVTSRDHSDTHEALQFLKGGDEWERMYSDNEGSIKTACKQLGVLWDPCQPGVHQNNGVIENTNLQIVYDIRVTLAMAGLPACMWPYALAYVCMIHNLTKGKDETTPWFKKFNEDFKGEELPLGCGVFYLPSAAGKRNSKAAPAMSYGIFLGYRLAPGSFWNKQYIVADIDDFIGASLSIDTPGTEWRLHPHLTEQIRLGKRGVCFPLKPVYDRANLTLEGRAATLGEYHLVEHDAYGVPTVSNKVQAADVSEPERSEEVLKVDRELGSKRLQEVIEENPDAIIMLEEDSDGEDALGGSDEDPDIPTVKQYTDYRGVTRSVKTDRFGTMITAKTPQKIPYYTNEGWRQIDAPTRVIMLQDWKKRQKRKAIRGVRGEWTGLSQAEREEVKRHFAQVGIQKEKSIEAAAPAIDEDWGTGICDLNVQLLERQLKQLEKGHEPVTEEPAASATENPCAGKIRGRNGMAYTGKRCSRRTKAA